MAANLNTGRHRYIHAIGCVTMQWNHLERWLDQLIWSYLEFDHTLGRLITGRLANVTKTDFLLDLARLNERDQRVVNRVEHAVTCFHICRENRNIIAHALPFTFYGRDGWVLAKRSKGDPSRWSRFRLKVSEIKRVQNDIVIADVFLQRLYLYRFDQWSRKLVMPAGKARPLPKKPLLPRKLNPLPPEALPDDWLPP